MKIPQKTSKHLDLNPHRIKITKMA